MRLLEVVAILLCVLFAVAYLVAGKESNWSRQHPEDDNGTE